MKPRRIRLLLFFIPLLLTVYFSQATPPGSDKDNNIVITSATETYQFDYSKSNKRVEVKQEMSLNYSCINYRDNAYFSEFFDDQSSLEEVTIVENGKKFNQDRFLKAYEVEGIFYSDARVYNLMINFPKSGTQKEIRIRKKILDPRYFCTVYLMSPYPISRKELSFVIPRWMKVEIKEFNLENYKVEKQQSYSAKDDADIIKYIIHDLPARKSESNQPGPSYVLPHLLVMSKEATIDDNKITFFNTLQDQYNWYRKMTGLLQNDKIAIKAKAEELTKGIADDLQKVKKVLYWVHSNIRYVAFEDGIAGFKPDEAQNVLNKKYGDCKGMANLTKELLVALGFDARLTWVGTNHIAYDYSTPSLCVDNHMICCLIYKRKKYFLDGTEGFLAFENYAERIQNRQVLIEDGDKYILERIPATTTNQNLTLFKEKLKVVNGVDLTGSIQYVYKGESKEQLLTAIHNTANEKLEQQLERYITNNNKNYEISKLRNSDVEQIDGDFILDFDLNYKSAISSFGNELYVEIDYNRFFEKLLIDTSRTAPYQFGYKYNYQSEVDLEIPPGYKVSSLPENFECKNPGFHFTINYKVEGNIIKYRKELRILNTMLHKSSFGDWNKAVKSLSEKYLEQIILVKQ